MMMSTMMATVRQAGGLPRPVLRPSSIFRCVPLGPPKPQSRDPATASPIPGAKGGSDGLAVATAIADAIVVETVNAEVYVATGRKVYFRLNCI